MKSISLTACMIIIVFSCSQAGNSDLTGHLWKIHRVEILKNNELKKVIDTGYQYWSFKNTSLIEIWNTEKIQKVLHFKMSKGSIKTYDTSGALQDEFFIERMGQDNMALSAHKKIEDAEYNIVYYLDKVKDTTAEDIKQGY
jgi:hypothetical protein